MTNTNAKAKDRHNFPYFEKLLASIKACEEGDKFSPNGYACMGCDMGEAGYSSKGKGHHDDDCFLIQTVDYITQQRESYEQRIKVLTEAGNILFDYLYYGSCNKDNAISIWQKAKEEGREVNETGRSGL